MSEALDKKVLDLMDKVKSKRAQIKEMGRVQWTTTCSLVLPGFERVNIQVEGSLHHLLTLIGVLRSMQRGFEDAARELGLKETATWQSFAIDDWVSDIKQRIRVMNINSEKKKLAEMEKKLNSLTSEEQRRAIALQELESELGE